jgi:hypothetical protein
MLSTMITAQNGWAQQLQDACKAYNETPNTTTHYAPLWLAGFGRDESGSKFLGGGGSMEHKKKEEAALQTARREVKKRNQEKKQQIEAQARKIMSGRYRKGTYVYVRPSRMLKGTMAKLERPWTGPWKILQRKSLWTVLVQLVPLGTAKVVNVRNIKPYRGSEVINKPISTTEGEMARKSMSRPSVWYPRALLRQPAPIPATADHNGQPSATVDEPATAPAAALPTNIQDNIFQAGEGAGGAEEPAESEEAEGSENPLQNSKVAQDVEGEVAEESEQQMGRNEPLRRSSRPHVPPKRFGFE